MKMNIGKVCGEILTRGFSVPAQDDRLRGKGATGGWFASAAFVGRAERRSEMFINPMRVAPRPSLPPYIRVTSTPPETVKSPPQTARRVSRSKRRRKIAEKSMTNRGEVWFSVVTIETCPRWIAVTRK